VAEAGEIVVRGAREHNLQNVDLVLPRNELICFTGVSGSGKSSLAFDTLYAEGQRRYVESLSTFARQFFGQMPKPEVDLISGLSPAISISQKSTGSNPRSTVGTVTEILDFLRVLYARAGISYCPECDLPIAAQTSDQIVARLAELPEGTQLTLLAPLVRGQKGEHRDLLADLLRQGFMRARVNGEIVSLTDDPRLDRNLRHQIEVVIDRIAMRSGIRGRLAEGVESALTRGSGTLIALIEEPGENAERETVLSSAYACGKCGAGFEAPTPQLFSFNSPHGMCTGCDGLGRRHAFSPDLLVPDPTRSFEKGAFLHLGALSEMGRWKRHLYKGVAETIDRIKEWPAGTMLSTPWRDLPDEARRIWLYGAGKTHITFTWRGGKTPVKYGGTFEGLIPELDTKYRALKSGVHRERLERYMDTIDCSVCSGERLNPQARAVRLASTHPDFAARPERSLPQATAMTIVEAREFFSRLELDPLRATIAAEAVKEICGRLGFLADVGLDYLTLDRPAPTLSGGETQRIRLASQVGCGLVGVLYILDEPSIGLHPRDNDRLIATLSRLRDQGNTVLVVEHDEETMWASDRIVDFGPGPGVRGGKVVAHGTPAEVAASKKSLTGGFLSGREKIEIPAQRRPITDSKLVVRGARQNNLKGIDVEIPLGAFVCVTGVSGSGKSSLVNDILVESLHRDLNQGEGNPGQHQGIDGLEHLDKLIAIDQSPIGRTPRSNPATYIKVFDEIRKLFTQLPDAKRRGYSPGRFSFNVDGGRCSACEGNGSTRLEMDFLADVWVTCPMCEGHRFNRETLQVRYKGFSIAEVLEMDVQQALDVFENVPAIRHRLQTLHDVGLDYLKLGQPSPTLSGGEAQRIKLARELVKRATGRTLYLLDEPTTGLHFADVRLLIGVLQSFVDAGNTVLVVEHNLDVIKVADHLIDLGPEGGDEGGRIVAVGTPEELATIEESHTGRALARLFRAERERETAVRKPPRAAVEPIDRIRVRGAAEHNLKRVDAEIPRDRITVFCGPSGSGKSSLAMDTIYAEGQRRYVESLSAYARQFVDQVRKPKLESIEGLSPAIAIEQKNLGSTPRSTVGTVTEIHDYLRILLSRLGTPNCPACDVPIGTQTSDRIVDKLLSHPEGTRAVLLAPRPADVGTDWEPIWKELEQQGYRRVRIDGRTIDLDQVPKLDRRSKHDVQIVVDRLTLRSETRSRIADSVETALALGEGRIQVAYPRDDRPESQWRVERHSLFLACDSCGASYEVLGPQNFSFNSPLGWCPDCEGLGTHLGANPAALVPDGRKSLAEGAVSLWPALSHPIASAMLEALSRETGLPIDRPFDELSSRWRRLVLHGTGERWIPVRGGGRTLFSFRYKGLYPALDEASRVSPSLRRRVEEFTDEVTCPTCDGSRLRNDAAAVTLRGATIDDLSRMPLGTLLETIRGWKLDRREKRIAGEVLREVIDRVRFLVDVGLEYLTLGRGAATLSNGEAQRIRLASQLGSGLCGVLYVLDEPTVGLHPRDNRRLLQALSRLRELGNTLIIVEHERDVLQAADRLIDFGPRAGRAGGEIVARGEPQTLGDQIGSVTGPYLNGTRSIPIPSDRRSVRPTATGRGKTRIDATPMLEVIGARHHNLKEVDVAIPLGTLTAVTGPSGCGKSSLIDDVLYASLARTLHRAATAPGEHREIRGIDRINKVIRVDQQPLGNSPTSNPATYTGVFELIRLLFAQMPDARIRGYSPRRFSFNVPGGRCEACEGNGQKKIEMHFLPDVWVTCEACQGRRYNDETLAVRFHGYSIADVLEMTCGEAVRVFENVPKIRRILQTLCDVGLDYVTLGQAAPTLSGGEAQRVKLAAELSRPDTGRTLYLLDEPSSGLHFEDLRKLLEVLQRLVDLGNTVVCIEHNLDVIKCCDWVIEMGPEAGDAGGQIVAVGTPEEIVAAGAKGRSARSKSLRCHTGEALASVLERGPYEPRVRTEAIEPPDERPGLGEVIEAGDARMPWEIDGRRWHCHDRRDRKGEAVRWDGRILERVIDRIEAREGFAPTQWNSRSVVEVTAEKSSLGWFLHALTAETWLLKLKFRVPRGTFRKADLQERIPLGTPNDRDDLPVYGNEPRVRLKSTGGPWQEIEIRAHDLAEIDIEGFWNFVDEACDAFVGGRRPAVDAAGKEDLEAQMPWKKLGRKWHLSRSGFAAGKKPAWTPETLEEVFASLKRVVPDSEFVWNLQVLVHLMIPEAPDPWVTVQTKKGDGIGVNVRVPRGSFTLGRIAGLAADRSVDRGRGDWETLRFLVTDIRQLLDDDWERLLTEAHERFVAALAAERE